MEPIKVNVTTDAAGDGSAVATQKANGVIYAVQLVDGDFVDGVDVTLTVEQDGVSIPVLVKADFNTDQVVYPRAYAAKVADGAALTDVVCPLGVGFPKVVVAQGGNAKSGSFIFYVSPNGA